MRFLARSLIGLLIAALTLGLIGYAGLRLTDAFDVAEADKPRPRAPRERVYAVEVGTIVEETLRPTVTAYGEIVSARRLELRPASGGALTAMSRNFRDGGRVTAGELLFRTDPAMAESDLSRARIALHEAEVEARLAAEAVALAERDFEGAKERAEIQSNILARQVDLQRRRVVTESRVETAILDRSAADQAALQREQALADARSRDARAGVALERARLALSDAQRALADTEVRAPFDGMLAEASAVLGRQVNAGEKLGVLVDPAEFEAAAPVSNAEYARLLDDDGALPRRPASVTLDLGARKAVFAGRVARAGAGSADAKTGRRLYVRLDAAAGEALREGDFVTLEIAEAPMSGVARLPATAVAEDGKALIVGRDERLEERQLAVLRRLGDDVVVGDAPFGAAVVLQRRPELGSGVRVRPVTPAEEGEEDAQDAPPPEALVELSPERRAALAALVEKSPRMPAERKAALLTALAEPRVPRRVLDRLERMEAALAPSGG